MPVSQITFISSTPGHTPDNLGQAIAEIQANDQMDWINMVDYYGDHGKWDVALAGVQATTANGMDLLLTSPGPGHHYVFQQGGPRSTWQGNFANGDAILCTDHSTSKLAINFGDHVSGFGMQIQPKSLVGEFNATLKVYWDATDTTVEPSKKDFLGLSNTKGDNSALFIGAESNRRNIFRIEMATYDRDWNACSLGINKLLINSN
jgi:hypothetical protein